MVRYFYAWTPLVLLGTVVLLSAPWLGLIALMVFSLVALVALAALAWAVVFVPYKLGRAISRRWRVGTDSSPRRSPALSPAEPQSDSVWEGAPSHAAALSVGRELQARQDAFSGWRVP